MIILPIALLWLAAQDSPSGGTLQVLVIDGTTSQAVTGATAVLTDVSRKCTTDTAGRCVFSNVAPGPQHLTVRRIGYRPHFLHAFVASVGALDLTIALTPLPEPLGRVRVESRHTLPLRDTESDDRTHAGDRSLSLAAIRNHPLLAEADGLLAVAGGHVTAKPESPGGLHILGGASDHVAYTVDGVPVLSPYHAGGTFGALNADALSRVDLQISSQGIGTTDALGGVYSAHTRAVPDRAHVAGGFSTTQARVMLETPLGRARSEQDTTSGAGLLLSGRRLFPGLLGQKHEAAHIVGDASDAMARLTLSAGSGTLRVLAFDARSDLAVANRVVDVDTGAAPARNDLRWLSNSLGAQWDGRIASMPVQLVLWRAATNSEVTWLGDSVPLFLSTRLHDVGVRGVMRRATGGERITIGMSVRRRSSDYSVTGGQAPVPDLDVRSSGMLAVLHTELAHRISARSDLSVGSSAAQYRGRVYLGPFAEWAWTPVAGVTLLVAASRRSQFTQSLRNPESPVANVFPADLSVGSGGAVPVAHGDQVMALAEWRPATARIFVARLWSRRLTGLVMPAIGSGEPFADTAIFGGSGRARGLSLDASLSGARWGLVASYVVQHVRLTAIDTTWQPEHGASQVVDAGIVYFPEPSAALRLGMNAGVGRRVSGFGGNFEWEACNLRDRGCEFAGGPLRRDQPLGAIALPAYARIDLGARKHWHLRLGSRDMQLALHATWSNLFDKRNVLTYTRDPVTNALRTVVMRPGSPFVVGLDWSF